MTPEVSIQSTVRRRLPIIEVNPPRPPLTDSEADPADDDADEAVLRLIIADDEWKGLHSLQLPNRNLLKYVKMPVIRFVESDNKGE